MAVQNQTFPRKLLRTEADFREAIAQAPDQASADLLARHLDTLLTQQRDRADLNARVAAGYDPFAGIRLADPRFDEAM